MDILIINIAIAFVSGFIGSASVNYFYYRHRVQIIESVLKEGDYYVLNLDHYHETVNKYLRRLKVMEDILKDGEDVKGYQCKIVKMEEDIKNLYSFMPLLKHLKNFRVPNIENRLELVEHVFKDQIQKLIVIKERDCFKKDDK